MADKITPRNEDYSRWYLDVIREAELSEASPVRGSMVIRPYGYALWEGIQSGLDRRFKETAEANTPLPFMDLFSKHVRHPADWTTFRYTKPTTAPRMGGEYLLRRSPHTANRFPSRMRPAYSAAI